MTPVEKVEILASKLKAKGKPKLTAEQEKKLKEHLETNYVELTEDDWNYFRENYRTTGYLPGVGTFGRTAADRSKKGWYFFSPRNDRFSR